MARFTDPIAPPAFGDGQNLSSDLFTHFSLWANTRYFDGTGFAQRPSAKIRGNELQVTEAKGVLPDGTAFSTTSNTHILPLDLRAIEDGEHLLYLSPQNGSRILDWRPVLGELRHVELSAIVLSIEPTDNSLPVARIEVAGETYRLSDFIAPVLFLNSDERLIERIGAITDELRLLTTANEVLRFKVDTTLFALQAISEDWEIDKVRTALAPLAVLCDFSEQIDEPTMWILALMDAAQVTLATLRRRQLTLRHAGSVIEVRLPNHYSAIYVHTSSKEELPFIAAPMEVKAYVDHGAPPLELRELGQECGKSVYEIIQDGRVWERVKDCGAMGILNSNKQEVEIWVQE